MRICAFCETEVGRKVCRCPICGKTSIIHMSRKKMRTKELYRDEMDIKALRGCVSISYIWDYAPIIVLGFLLFSLVVLMTVGRLLC